MLPKLSMKWPRYLMCVFKKQGCNLKLPRKKVMLNTTTKQTFRHTCAFRFKTIIEYQGIKFSIFFMKLCIIKISIAGKLSYMPLNDQVTKYFYSLSKPTIQYQNGNSKFTSILEWSEGIFPLMCSASRLIVLVIWSQYESDSKEWLLHQFSRLTCTVHFFSCSQKHAL